MNWNERYTKNLFQIGKRAEKQKGKDYMSCKCVLKGKRRDVGIVSQYKAILVVWRKIDN